jgi:hypothetical protein
MNNPDHIFESLETFFLVKILKFFDADLRSGILKGDSSDPGSGMEKSRIRDKHPGSATLDLRRTVQGRGKTAKYDENS